MRRFWLACVLVVLSGCTSASDLVVDLRTDWRPSADVASLEVRVTPQSGLAAPPAVFRSVDASEPFLTGARIAELRALPHGNYVVRVRLFDRSSLVLGERSVLVTLSTDSAVTMIVTRTCANRRCSDGLVCQSGECIEPTCSPETPEGCPPGECAIDLDCGGEFSDCGAPRCIDGVCFATVVEGTCAAEEVCDPIHGCLPRECATPRSRPVANWDVVPEQTVTSPFEVGVLAFHEHGSRVVFSIGGGEVLRSEAPVLNPRTGVAEHVLVIPPGTYPDGPLRISAVAESLCPGHDSRTLDELTLWMNDRGTLANDERWVDCTTGDDDADGSELMPFATIDRALEEVGGGGTIRLAAGSCYEGPVSASARTRWTTIRPADGAAPGSVRIRLRSSEGARSIATSGLRFEEVVLFNDADGEYFAVLNLDEAVRVWLDRAEVYDAARGRNGRGRLVVGRGGSRLYLTDGRVHDLEAAAPHFTRGTVFERVGSTLGIGTDRVAVNVRTTLGDGTRGAVFGGYYPDGYVENVIVYGIRALGLGPQSLFGIEGHTRDVAFVNALIETDPPGVGAAQLSGGWDHALFWHVTITGTSLLLRSQTPRNVFLENGLFSALGDTEGTLGWRITNNHYAAPTSTGQLIGEEYSVGDPGFVDPASDDFHIAPGSPAATRGRPLLDVPLDIDGVAFGDGPRAAGGYAPSP